MKTLKKLLLGLVTVTAMAVFCALCAGAESFENFNYSLLDDGSVVIEDYTGSAAVLEIPSDIDGKAVTAIGNKAFYYCSTLKTVIIPEGVTTIGESAFARCSSLRAVELPDSLETIGKEAFYYCRYLNSVEMPESIESIGEGAFYYCKSLTSIVIPDGVTSIQFRTFSNCTSLTSVVIPDSVESVDERAFSYCSSLVSVTIADGVSSIGGMAFYNCTQLNSISIPDSVTYICDYAFYNTAWYDNKPDGIVYAGKVAYDYKGKITDTEIVLKSGTLGIAENAFANCSTITSVKIPKSVTSIGDMAFYNCKLLATITIPESVTSIGINALHKTKWYDNKPDGVVYAGKVAYGYKGEMPGNTTISLKDGTVGIADSAFYRCVNLISIKIPSGVTNVGDMAFNNCSSLVTVRIPGSVANIGDDAFNGRPEEMTFYTPAGSYSENYAIENKINTIASVDPPSVVSAFTIGGRASDALRLNWDKNAGADGYIISVYQDGKWTRIAKIDDKETVTYRVEKLQPSTTYKFRICAYIMSGKSAYYSDYSTVSGTTSPSIIKGLKIGGKTSSSISLTWTKNTSADGYIIEMYSGNKWVRVTKLTSNANVNYTKTGLTAGTSYKFRIRAYNMAGNTALYSSYANITGATS